MASDQRIEAPDAVGFDALYGLELRVASPTRITGRVAVRDELRQPTGLIHGGVYAAMAESLASYGTTLTDHAAGKAVMGMSNHTSFVRPITTGVIHASATCRHAGRTTAVWEVEITDDAGRLCALTRVTVAIR